MKIKTKLIYLIGSLLALIILLGFFSAKNVYRLKDETDNLLTDNYNSIRYAREMLAALNYAELDSILLDDFAKNMELQRVNVTEMDEMQATERLIFLFEQFRQEASPRNLAALKGAVDRIMQLNMNSIYYKSRVATETANRSLIWIILLASLSSVIALIMFLKLPRSLTRPIQELVDGIDEVSKQHYDKRLQFDSHSEFAAVARSFNDMTEQLTAFRRSSLADIMAAKSYLETIINSINEPIIVLDSHRIVLFTNNAAMNILNLKAEQVMHRSALDVSLNNDLFRRLIRGLEPDTSKDEPLKIYSDNKECYFQVHYTPIEGESGTVIILSNITEFKELDNAKTNFISTISHELKTPISAILMSLKLLEDDRIGAMNEEQKALSQSIKESSDRLLNITGELLKMTQVETGKLQLSPKVTKPIELITYAVNATKVLADRFGCNIEVEYPEKLPKLFVDSEKIAWVITNLLSNAIHYSQENARIIIGAQQIGRQVEIYVQDFGRGIDPRYHRSIFDRYFRVPGTKTQGSGLGLAISKEFVEAHQGTIRIDSQLGHGSRFTVSLQVP